MEQRHGTPLNIGEVAAIPASGILKCKYILHAVGPTWVDGITHGEEELLLKTVVNALKMANQMQLESVSMPLLCTDELFGFPKVSCFCALCQTKKTNKFFLPSVH